MGSGEMDDLMNPPDNPIVEQDEISPVCPKCGTYIGKDNARKDTCEDCEKREHPIPKRPDWLWKKRPAGCYVYRGHGEQDARDYIERLEHDLKVTEKALSDAHTRLEAIYEQHGEDVEDAR